MVFLKNDEYGNKAYCTMNEGLGKVLRYGAYSEEVIKKLKWMEEVLYPTLNKAIQRMGKIDLKNIIAQSLHMGDELHNRNRAATSLFYRIIAPQVVRSAIDTNTATSVLDFIHNNDQVFFIIAYFFFNLPYSFSILPEANKQCLMQGNGLSVEFSSFIQN